MAAVTKGKKLPTGIRKKNTNSFEIRVKHDGKTYYEYAPTLTEAKKKRVDLKYRLAHGTYIKPTSYTFNEWFNFWIENYDVGVKTINKFNPIPYSTLKKFIFCSISPRFGEYMTGIPYLVLCKYRIWGIVSQTLHIIEEFPEIQRCYLGTEKELATLFPTRNLFQMVILTDI